MAIPIDSRCRTQTKRLWFLYTIFIRPRKDKLGYFCYSCLIVSLLCFWFYGRSPSWKTKISLLALLGLQIANGYTFYLWWVSRISRPTCCSFWKVSSYRCCSYSIPMMILAISCGSWTIFAKLKYSIWMIWVIFMFYCFQWWGWSQFSFFFIFCLVSFPKFWVIVQSAFNHPKIR